MAIFRRLSAIPLFLLLASAAIGSEVYRNDFSTRTSKQNMPRATWYEKDYAYPAPLYYTRDAWQSGYTPTALYQADRAQDGWVRIHGNNYGDGTQNVNFWVRTNNVPELAVATDGENPMGCFSNSSGYYGASDPNRGDKMEVMAITPFMNAFSNGTVRVSVDMRPPGRMTENGYFRVKPLFEGCLSPSYDRYAPYGLSIGFLGTAQLMFVGSDGNWASPEAKSDGVIKSVPLHWYRFVADLNLDESTYTGQIYDMGTAQPLPDAATPGTPYTGAHGYLYRRVADAGALCGIGLHCQHVTTYSLKSKDDNTLVMTNAVVVDNLRVAWKAPGSSSFESCYENDFAHRRYRTLSPVGTKEADYASALAVPASDSCSYWGSIKTNLLSSADVSLVTSKTATGRDGWRMSDGAAFNALVNTESDGKNVLAFAGNTKYTMLAHPIGQSISTGKVKLEADLRTPDKWYTSSSRTFTVLLGNDDFLTNSGAYSVRVGIGGVSDDKTMAMYPYAYLAEGTGSRTSQDVPLSSNVWYRVRVVADMEAKTYDFSLFRLGKNAGPYDRTVPDEPLVTRTGIGFNPSWNVPFSTFSVFSYASGNNWNGAELLDNVRIWKGTDGVNWSLVYRNDFNTRIRYGARTVPETKLLDTDINRDGLDGWIRRGLYTGDLFVRGDTNPCIAFEDEQDIVHATHRLGKAFRRGKVQVRADIRPPTRSCSYSAQIARVYVGGDEYAQGEFGTYEAKCGGTLRPFTEATAGYFGFARTGNTNTLGYYTQFKILAYDAAGSHTSTTVIEKDDRDNWYRFIATFDVDQHAWSLNVYNQGTTRPTPDDANGTLVQSFSDLTFTSVDPAGISAIGLAAGASCGTQPLAADTKGVLFDNILITRDDGTAILVK